MCFKVAALCLLCALSVSAIAVSGEHNVVWFPNPASSNPNDLIPAYLTRPESQVEEDETDLSKAHFLLYTKDNRDVPDELFVGDDQALANSNFRKDQALKIMIHGFGGDIDHTFPWEIRGEFLNITTEDINVILLDWSELAESPDYVGAVTNAHAVANLTAEFLQFLLDCEVTTLDKVHFIGFSLGGQVVGIAANRFTRLTGKVIPRVTSLDPALPMFDIAVDDDRISPDDGTFVDVIHTASGLLGMFQPRGHIDFYPNGGTKQPGCGVDIVGACAHSRAPAFFKESFIGEKLFRACKCESWEEFDTGACACTEEANLGYNVDQKATGTFYLRTNEEEPYAIG
jgi:pancreatic triacylglycerol lipase